jgi:hypothetical protein
VAVTGYCKAKGIIGMNDDSSVPINYSWREDAACKGLSVDTYDDFFPVSITKVNINNVKAIFTLCQRCEVSAECMQEALMHGYDGIWGRSTYKQRQSYTRHILHNNLENLTLEKCKDFVADLCGKNLSPTTIYARGNRKDVYEKMQEDSSINKDKIVKENETESD